MSLLNNKPYIVIAGNIGVGKSTLTQKLGDALKLPVYHEDVSNNPYLVPFYKNKREWAFQLQVYLYIERYRIQQQITWMGLGRVQDRSIYEDLMFADVLHDNGDICDEDYKTYLKLTDTFDKTLTRPDVIIYLKTDPKVALERVKIRNREMETEAAVSLEYLTQLHNAYEKFIPIISKNIPVIVIDWNEFGTTDNVIDKITDYCEAPKISVLERSSEKST